MFTKFYDIEEFKELFIEILLNKTNKVSKVTDGSVLNGVAFGNAKMGQKINKEVGVIESHIFPDFAFGEYLDDQGRLKGIGERFGPKRSSTYLRIFAQPGTIYIPGTNDFISRSGITFELSKPFVMNEFGYGYAKVRSKSSGASSNVDALTINEMTNKPVGHQYVINEYAAQYATDFEEDDVYRKRIKEGVNILARSTISMFEQVLVKINENVLRVFFTGVDSNGKYNLTVLSENGMDFTDEEFNDMLLRGEKFFSMSEFRSPGNNEYTVVFKNMDWQPIDYSARLAIHPSYNPDLVRKELQSRINKYMDYRYWKTGQRVEWDNLLEITKNTDGIQYVNDAFFYPKEDVLISSTKLPRIRGFQLLDLNGNLIYDKQGILNPVYYPNLIDFSYQAAVLRTI